MSDDNNSTAMVTRQAKPVEVVRDALERMKPQLTAALPKHLTAERLVRVAMTAVQTTPKLLDCDRQSFYRAIFTCAQLGLEPDGVDLSPDRIQSWRHLIELVRPLLDELGIRGQ